MADPFALSLDEFAARCLRPMVVQRFGQEAIDLFDDLLAKGADIEDAAEAALIVSELRG